MYSFHSCLGKIEKHSYLGGGGGLWFIRLYLNQWLVMVIHACHTNYMEKHKEEVDGQGWYRHKARTHLNKNQCKKGWGSGSSGKVPV
jgi:hypothetical protein